MSRSRRPLVASRAASHVPERRPPVNKGSEIARPSDGFPTPDVSLLTKGRFSAPPKRSQHEEQMNMNTPPIVSPQEWKVAREELLAEEKELTHARDALAAKRRRMPRMAVENDYVFEGPNGPASLLDLFEGRRQLIVYRFFFEPGVHGWPDGGCPGCSWVADQITHPAHLNARGTTIALISRAPQADIGRWKA